MSTAIRASTWKPSESCSLKPGDWLQSNHRKALVYYVSSPPHDVLSAGFLTGHCGLSAIDPMSLSVRSSASAGPVLAASPPVCTASCFYCQFEWIYGLLMLTVVFLLYPHFL